MLSRSRRVAEQLILTVLVEHAAVNGEGNYEVPYAI